MKLLIDFFPIILFFAAFKVWGIYTATAVAIGTRTPRTSAVVWLAPPPKPTRTPAAPARIRCNADW